MGAMCPSEREQHLLVLLARYQWACSCEDSVIWNGQAPLPRGGSHGALTHEPLSLMVMAAACGSGVI